MADGDGDGANAIQEAMKRIMAENKPNSGHRPPGLQLTEDSHKNCSTCVHFNGAGLCKLYEYKVNPNEVCESWEPQPQ